MFKHRFKFYYIFGLIIYSFLNILVLNGDRLYAVRLPSAYLLIVIAFLCTGIWLANLAIEKFVLKRVRGVHPLISQFILSILAIIALSVVSVLLTSTFLGEPFNFIQKNILLTSGFSFRVNLFLNTVNAVYFFNQKYREKEIESEKLKTATIAARYEALNNQINPHFLFNNLNTLATLVKTDTNKAELFIQKFSDFYRYSLRSGQSELVTLREEMDFLNNYITLLNIRFGASLEIHKDIEDDKLNKHLPPSVLQLLLENVVKHNYFTLKEPVKVSITSDNNYVVIKNTLQEKSAKDQSLGIGLSNISERYRFFNKKVQVEKDKKSFTVTVPLIDIANESTNN